MVQCFLGFVAHAASGLLRPLEFRPNLRDQQIDSSLPLIVIAIHGHPCAAIHARRIRS
jgi:hypothetical protein